MGNKVAPNPADFDTYEQWVAARQKFDDGRVFGPPPPKARGVLVWLVLAVLVLVVSVVVMNVSGASRRHELRSGTAQVTECSSGLSTHVCHGIVRWSDGATTKDATIKSGEPVSGEVAVGGWEVWRTQYQNGAFYHEEIWADEHRPESRPLLFPVICLLTLALLVLLGWAVVGPAGRWAASRSRRRWVRARQAAGRPAELIGGEDS